MATTKEPVELPAELMREITESFDALDAEKTGFITSKDEIYALFLSLGVTFNSEEEFLTVL